MQPRPLDLLHDNISNVAVIIEAYEQFLDNHKEHLRLKGKHLVVANNEQPAWFVYYESRRAELKAAVDFMDAHVQKTRGHLWRSYTEHYSRDLPSKDKDQYINNEPAYLLAVELYLELKDLYDRFVAVVEAFKMRGFALNNITRLVCANAMDYLID